MQRLRDANPALREGWMIVNKRSRRDLIPSVHGLSEEKTRKKMEDLIQDTVLKTMDWEFEADPLPVKECNEKILQQLEERKSKMIELKKDKYGLKANDERKLQTASNKLATANDKLKILLDEADEETIKENIPDAVRRKCWEAWHCGTTRSFFIRNLIMEKRSLNLVDDLSAVEEAVKNTEAKRKMLQAILNSMQPQ